jgi:predicted Zn-dependent protease
MQREKRKREKARHLTAEFRDVVWVGDFCAEKAVKKRKTTPIPKDLQLPLLIGALQIMDRLDFSWAGARGVGNAFHYVVTERTMQKIVKMAKLGEPKEGWRRSPSPPKAKKKYQIWKIKSRKLVQRLFTQALPEFTTQK